jgi:hypothetical protein
VQEGTGKTWQKPVVTILTVRGNPSYEKCIESRGSTTFDSNSVSRDASDHEYLCFPDTVIAHDLFH